MKKTDRKKILIMIVIAISVLAFFYSLKHQGISLQNEYWNYTCNNNSCTGNVHFTLINKKKTPEDVTLKIIIRNINIAPENLEKVDHDTYLIHYTLKPKSVLNVKEEFPVTHEPISIFITLQENE